MQTDGKKNCLGKGVSSFDSLHGFYHDDEIIEVSSEIMTAKKSLKLTQYYSSA